MVRETQSNKDAFDRLSHLYLSVLALTLSGADQLVLFPNEVAKADELAIELGEAMESMEMTNFHGLSDNQASAVRLLDETVHNLPKGPSTWSDDALLANPRWQEIRELAKAALRNGDWPAVAPADLRFFFGPPADEVAFARLVQELESRL